MARDWWRVVLAASVVATLGAMCVFGGQAEAAKGAKRQDPAEAQRAIEAAKKLLGAGKIDQAVRSLSATLGGGNLPPAVMAKAFYERGMAYREQKKPALAISDLTSALWLRGGLGAEDRADALKQRVEAYADAGLTERGEVLRPATASRQPQAQPERKSGSNWLSSVFGTPPAPPPASRPTPTAAKAPGGLGGWASKTEVQAAARPAAVKPPKAEPAEAEPAESERPRASAGGKYQVQVATVRTKAEAMALAAKAMREHAAVLASSEPEIDRAVLGNMGSFYRVRFGPFADAQQTQAVCAKLQGSGLDCMPIAR